MNKKGFTLIELLLVLGIIFLLLGFSLFSATTSLGKNTTATVLNVLISDIKEQQLKAMVGDSEGRTAADSYGIHFETNRYVLFHGTVYNAADSANFAIDLDQTMQFTNITFPGGNLIFNQSSGEVRGYASGQNTVIMTNSASAETETVTVNRLGSITSITSGMAAPPGNP